MEAYIEVKYNSKNHDYSIDSNLDQNKIKNMLETYLLKEIGKEADNSKPNELDIYEITFSWHSPFDQIKITSNTGNKALESGIIFHIFNKEFKH